jgi:hypothetical protein
MGSDGDARRRAARRGPAPLREERDDGPLADLEQENRTIMRAERVDGYGAGLAQLIVNWGRVEPDRDGRSSRSRSLADRPGTGSIT